MKPAPFAYYVPETVAEAVGLLVEHGDEAKIIAGGQSLIPTMNMRLARPSALVDVCRIPELQRFEVNGAVAIGATARHQNVLRSAEITAAAPIISAALVHVGHGAIRNRGTVGGSIAHADPAAELPAILLALDGQVVVTGSGGDRLIDADDFFVTFLTTSIAEDEVLTEIRIPQPPRNVRRVWSFEEVGRRHGDFALVGTAFVADLDEDGAVRQARIALMGVADRPLRARAAESELMGRRLDDPQGIRAAAAAAADGIDPVPDAHASGEYRKEVTAALVARSIRQAAGLQEG